MAQAYKKGWRGLGEGKAQPPIRSVHKGCFLLCTDYSNGVVLISGTCCRGPPGEWRAWSGAPFQLAHHLWPWANLLTSVCLDFLLCKAGTVSLSLFLPCKYVVRINETYLNKTNKQIESLWIKTQTLNTSRKKRKRKESDV